MDPNITALEVVGGVSIAVLIIWALAWLERRGLPPKFRENRRMHRHQSEHS